MFRQHISDEMAKDTALVKAKVALREKWEQAQKRLAICRRERC